uniref:Transmembrane protein n=1 Tax=Parascaris univalens TaxID=6257 RepID=A0A915C1F6_PARUN
MTALFSIIVIVYRLKRSKELRCCDPAYISYRKQYLKCSPGVSQYRFYYGRPLGLLG